MTNLRRSVLITFASTNASTIVQFGVTIVLSRLLTPAEVGIFSITVVFINIIAVFRDFGVSSYLQQEKNLTRDKARAAFGLLLTSSFLLATATYFARHQIADFYREPGIASVLAVLCISYAIVPFASYFYSMLARDLQAGRQAIVNLVSTLVYATTCLVLAYLGFSYMALAWANVANITANIIVYLSIRPRGIPLLPKFTGWSSPLRFGSGAILGSLLERIHVSIPDLVLGRISGAHDVGLYSRANGLVGIFQQVVGPTVCYNAVPYIAKNHHASTPLAPILAKATSYLTGVGWPAFIFIAAFAEEIIRLLYGPGWLAASPVVGVLAFQALIRYGYSLTQPALMAIGRPYLSAVSAGASIAARLAIIGLIGAEDLVSFAIALCIADVLTLFVPIVLMSRNFGYTFRAALQAHWPSAKVGFACLLAVAAMKVVLPSTWADFFVLSVAFATVAAVWIFSIIKLAHPLAAEIQPLVERLCRRQAG